MDLSRRLCTSALVLFIVLICIESSHTRFHGIRQKRQYGANLYLSASSITPGGDGDDPSEWTDWSSPSECSRSCGGGVSYQTRDCRRLDYNGEPICNGGSRRYYSCNTQDCPEDDSDFRAAQCSRFDTTQFDGTLYDWVPYLNAPNPCELNCMPKGQRFYYRQKEKVIDGTRCNDKDLDVCVDGQCQPVGCDMMLGSSAREDQCRQCNGDGSSCRTIKDTFTTNNLAAGYNDILLVPSGATNIRIEETAPSNNYLACRNLTGHYYLNGNWRIDFPRPMHYAGCWWNYQRKPAGFAAPDQLTCSGPITESIYVVMLVQDKNVSIDYEYSIPETVRPNTPDVYTWTHMEYGPCSASCGGGTQTREIKCNNRLNLQEVDPSLCDEHSKPAEKQECGTEPCAPHWIEGDWTKCSKGCGADGTQNRTITCERISPTGEHTAEVDAVCLKLVGNKPATTQECNRDVKNCPKYHLGPWTPCDKLCGEGKQTRKATCFIEENGHKRVLSDEDCVEDKPETEKSCTLAPCEGVDWIISQWSGCKACGQNKETRTAICGSKSGKVYSDEFCAPEVPLLSRPCESKKCDSQWFSSEWSKCSSACGKGVQNRIIICGVFDGKSVTPAADDSKCNAETKPESEQECEGEEKVCPGQWFTGPWEDCSKECGGGERVREVLCLANGTKADNCEESKVEAISEKCNVQPCTENNIIPVTPTDKTIEDDDSEEVCSEEDDDAIDIVTDKLSEDLKISDGIDLDEETTTLSSLLTDELMLSDAPSDDSTIEASATDISTVEGSVDTDSTSDSSLTTEGSGYDSTSDSSLTTEGSGYDSTIDFTGTTSSSGASESTDVSSSTNDSTEQTSEPSDLTSGASTDITSESSGSTGLSEDTTESSTDTSENTSAAGVSVTDDTEASGSTESSTDSSSDNSESSGTSESASESSSPSSDFTTDSSQSTELTSSSTDTTNDESTLSTSESSTESTSEVSTESTSEFSTESTSEFTTDSTTEFTTESTSEFSTESTSQISTDSTTEFSTVSTSEFSTESTSEMSTSETQSSTDNTSSSSESSDSTTESSESTTSSSDTTDSTSSNQDSTETTESSSSNTQDTSTVSTDTSDTTDSSASTDSTSQSTDSSTDVSGSTSSAVSTESTDATTDASTELSSTESSESTTTGVSESTEISSSTEESSSTATDASTETGETDGSTTESSTDSTLSTEGGTTKDIWSTSDDGEGDTDTTSPNTLESAITKASKPRKCKPKKQECTKSIHGCCPDNKTAAKGPFDKGCPIAKTCAETKFGCCLDGVSPAAGKNHKGCPKSQCAETLFGCCPDKFTPAEGENDDGCPELTTLPPTTTIEVTETELEGSGEEATTEQPETRVESCSSAEFGCCADGKTAAKGEAFQGCEEPPTDKKDCHSSANGCCPDGRTAASGPNGEGCAECTREPFGCCPDNSTPAHGLLFEGCCLNSPYGCCPDNINSARGPNFEDCDCKYTPYGCCPDQKSAARGSDNEGCHCETTPNGCCPDKITAAKGPKFQGCPCETTQFGCCPDGLTFAQGPHHYGCHCTQTEFKCCADEKTPAKGPNFEGCTCVESKHGCCPDGVTAAEGDKFEGCQNVKEPLQKACGLHKDTGPCGNFSIKYHFDTTYGACAKFWYGGCDGNDNRFESEGECKQQCEDYTGKDVCYLPKVPGPCTENTKKWHFDAERNRCEEFTYGGCYGNHNRFETIEECQNTCTASESLPPCEQPAEAGPCEGNYERWFYDNTTDVCLPFGYGGCKGNKNNHPTEHACNYNCRQPGVLKDYCSLPKQIGDCSEHHARWYFSESDKRCMPFYYTGCGGNKNNFPSVSSCEDHCPRQVAKDICEIPAEVGECTNYTPMWYFDTKSERCQQFYYGGCGGNENRFGSEDACLARCEKRPEPTTPPPPPAPAARRPTANVCAEPADPGNCDQYVLNWYFDAAIARCRQFYYGSCGGNGNRFATEAECANQCISPDPQPQAQPQPARRPAPAPKSEPAASGEDRCNLPAAPGECDEYELNYFYNTTVGQCEPFYYGGCGGNENRFKNESACTNACALSINTRFGEPDEEHPPDNNVALPETAKCFLPQEYGDCQNNETRWYYNSQEGLCDAFLFSGCGGNANNYATEDECQNECIDAQHTCSLPPVQGRCDERTERWYYDERTRRCYEFEFTGCRGNRNNFVTEAECINFCNAEQPPQEPESRENEYSICNLPLEAGECDNNTNAWFYDRETMLCTAFTYSGCGGNGNRFASKEQCERQCGEFKDVDVCHQQVLSGPCTQWQTVFYYNERTHACEPFTYGGCDGNGNRFSHRAECEKVCIVGQEPKEVGVKDICLLPAVVGQCNGPTISERRWFYDDARGTCVSFIYSGCSGNQNNFRSFEACSNYCGKPVEENTNNEITPDRCETYESECQQLRCPYGVRRVPATEECNRCECENPCLAYNCPEGQQCSVDFASDDSHRFVPVCREINKPGVCPQLAAQSAECVRECYTDADCRDDNKCCSNGCSQVCVRAGQPPRTTQRPTSPAPAVIYPGEVKATLEPKQQPELDVQSSIGNIAVLRCFATGIPAPNVTWSRHNVLIDTNQGRYVLTSSGDLTIVQVRQTDNGTYVCVASNGLGEPVRREISLQVTESKDIPAYIYGDKNATQIVTLNSPAYVRCPAGGHPVPHVSWWRNRKQLALLHARYELTRDYSLLIRSTQLSDLGPYTCEVYNRRGRPSSMTITLKAVGPARAVTDNDAQYLQYIINAAALPTPRRPTYPYHPTRPAYVPPPVYVEPPSPPPTLNAQAVLGPDPRNSYSPGSTIALSCSVQGYPVPNVTWTKDGQPLYNNDRVQITAEPHRLVISDITTEDTGLYGCSARNSFSYSNSEDKIVIESSIPVSPECVDNPYFANCKLIVQGQYCRNHYYAKFCCRSCTLAGQIMQAHPNAL